MSDTRAAPTMSFEFFPPATPEAAYRLWASVERLGPLGPKFVSVTYGAGGATRDRTMSAIQAIRDRARLTVAGHLTCVGASREETLDVARRYRALGARRIVALRGDAPKGAERFEPHPEGFSGAAELVAALRRDGHEQISVACYPEGHPEGAGVAADIEHLKRKLDAGADSAISQFFFENEDFLRFRDAAVKAGVTAPIIPGLLPVENFRKMARFAAACQASVPAWMADAFANAEEKGCSDLLATSICAEQCDGLIEEGVEHVHLYTLNNPELPYAVCRALGVTPAPLAAAAGGAA